MLSGHLQPSERLLVVFVEALASIAMRLRQSGEGETSDSESKS